MQVTERRRVRTEDGAVTVDKEAAAQREAEERRKAEQRRKAEVTAAKMTDPRKDGETWGYV